MRYLRAVNLEKYQHYDPAKRKLVWVKLYIDLLTGDDRAYRCLSDVAKAHLHHFWMLATKVGNVVDADEKYLQNRLNIHEPFRGEELLAGRFVQWCDERGVPIENMEQIALPLPKKQLPAAPKEIEQAARPKPDKKIPVPDPFLVNDDLRTYAAAKAPLVDVDEETEMLVEHFRDINPIQRTMRGWVATWRKWMRKAQADAARRPGARRERLAQTADQVKGFPTAAIPRRSPEAFIAEWGSLDDLKRADLRADYESKFLESTGTTWAQYRSE